MLYFLTRIFPKELVFLHVFCVLVFKFLVSFSFFQFPPPIREIGSFQYLSFTASNLRNINRLVPRFLFPESSSPVILIFLLPFSYGNWNVVNWHKFATKITELNCVINMSVKVCLLNLLKGQFSILTQSQLDSDVTFEHMNNVFASKNIVIYYLIALSHRQVTLVELYWSIHTKVNRKGDISDYFQCNI